MNMKLKTKIKEFRAELDISQGELAAMVGVKRETISRLERGLYIPSLKLAMDIAKVFCESVEELFFFNFED